jgi:hypothetical protein
MAVSQAILKVIQLSSYQIILLVKLVAHEAVALRAGN